MSTGAAMLAAGGRVWLATCEEDGPVGGDVFETPAAVHPLPRTAT